MALQEAPRRRLLALLAAAIVLLVARVGASELGASPDVERLLYALAVLCLVGCVVVVVRARVLE